MEGGSNCLWGMAICPYPAKALCEASDIPEGIRHLFLKNVTEGSFTDGIVPHERNDLLRSPWTKEMIPLSAQRLGVLPTIQI